MGQAQLLFQKINFKMFFNYPNNMTTSKLRTCPAYCPTAAFETSGRFGAGTTLSDCWPVQFARRRLQAKNTAVISTEKGSCSHQPLT